MKIKVSIYDFKTLSSLGNPVPALETAIQVRTTRALIYLQCTATGKPSPVTAEPLVWQDPEPWAAMELAVDPGTVNILRAVAPHLTVEQAVEAIVQEEAGKVYRIQKQLIQELVTA